MLFRSTYHPTTLEFEQAEWQIDELLTALAETKLSLIFALPNADTGNRVIREKLERFVASNHSTMLVDNFGPQAYFSMMNLATAMVGNSSSGIVESTSFRLPVVNIGARQHGRIIRQSRPHGLSVLRRGLRHDFGGNRRPCHQGDR